MDMLHSVAPVGSRVPRQASASAPVVSLIGSCSIFAMWAIFCGNRRRTLPTGWQAVAGFLGMFTIARQIEAPDEAPDDAAPAPAAQAPAPCPCCYYRHADIDPVTGVPVTPGWVDFGSSKGWTWWHGDAPHGRYQYPAPAPAAPAPAQDPAAAPESELEDLM